MEHLERELNTLLSQLPNADEFRGRLDSLVSVYPFNDYEFIISTLLGLDILTLDGYYNLRDSYIERNYYLTFLKLARRVNLEKHGLKVS